MNFKQELKALLNKHSKENGSDTPDFILVEYMSRCLDNFDQTVQQREAWYGRVPKEVKPSPPPPEEEVKQIKPLGCQGGV